MSRIEAYLDEASKAYYEGKPFLADDVFDHMANMIQYSKVGAKQHTHLAKHWTRLYSLDKYYEGEGTPPLKDVSNKINTPKLDGAAISILYIEGDLAQVLTRGDGIEGTIITDKFLATSLIPKKIEHKGILQVTGEIVAPKEIPNARNYAAGALNLKDIEEFKTKAISFYAYGVSPYITDNYISDMRYLKDLGFETVLANDLHNIYPCDGIVVRLIDNQKFEDQGFTSKFPKGAYAIKERGEAVETELLSVTWSTGKTGKVTPVAHLKPVMIGDALVSKATLNNPGFIEMLDLAIGDIVGVIRSGEIIPTIVYKVDA